MIYILSRSKQVIQKFVVLFSFACGFNVQYSTCFFRCDGVRHVRDGGLGVPEEREARHPYPPRGCQEGRQAGDARPHARSV